MYVMTERGCLNDVISIVLCEKKGTGTKKLIKSEHTYFLNGPYSIKEFNFQPVSNTKFCNTNNIKRKKNSRMQHNIIYATNNVL